MQGRGDHDAWVGSIKVAYSLNGVSWDYVEDGKVFPANSDRYTKVHINFAEPIYARAIRIYPQTYKTHIALRFDAIYIDL